MIFDLLNQIGGCVLYHDYRSGSYRDWSGNDNAGTPTGAGLTRGGADFHAQSDLITVPFSSELDVGNGDGMAMIVLVPDYLTVNTGTTRRFYEQVGGIACYLDANNNTIVFLVDNAPSVLAGISPTSDSSKCFGVSWADGDAPELFLDGIFHANFPTALNKGIGIADIGFGNRIAAGRTLGQTMSAVCLFNKALTATEHSELYGALAATRWPTKVYSYARPALAVDRDEAGIVAGYDMRPVAGKVFDASGNGYDLTVDGQVFESPGMVNAGETDLNTGITATQLNPRTESHTVSCWFRADDLATAQAIIGKGAGAGAWSSPPNGGIGLAAGGALYYRHYKGSGPTYETIFAGTSVVVSKWYHAAYVVNRVIGEVRLYVNGVSQGTVSEMAFVDNPAIDSDGFRIFGIDSASTIYPFIGSVASPKIFNVAKDQTWVTAEYEKGARELFKTGFGARETSVNVTTGPISNTPFEVVSGSFKVVTDTIDGTPTKVLECVTAGTVAMPSSYFGQGEGDAARGTFDFWFYKSQTSSVVRAQVISNRPTVETDASFNGYALRLEPGEEISLYRRISGAGFILQATAAGYAPVGDWARYTVTVGNGGVFTTYLDGAIVDLTGGSGTNPTTDTTYTESKYFVADLDAGDKIALGAVDGSYGITKRLGVNTDGL